MANTIIFFIAINNYYSNTDWYIITIAQTSKLATWQKRLIHYSAAGLLVRYITRATAVNHSERAIHWKRGGGGSYIQPCLKIGTGVRLGLGSRRTWYTVGGHTK